MCGEARLFRGYLTIVPACPSCHTELGKLRADDAPPYFTILAVGHIIVPLMLWMQVAQDPSTLTMSLIFLPATLMLTLLLLRPIKGATAGAMLSMDMLRHPAGQ
jgi:uncharacterized protein (DUF983 family)